jgi:hypothetical protein
MQGNLVPIVRDPDSRCVGFWAHKLANLAQAALPRRMNRVLKDSHCLKQHLETILRQVSADSNALDRLRLHLSERLCSGIASTPSAGGKHA